MTDLITGPGSTGAPLSLRLALRDVGGITRRNLLRILRTPQLMFMSVLQPTIILLLFRYVLGGAIRFPASTMSISSCPEFSSRRS